MIPSSPERQSVLFQRSYDATIWWYTHIKRCAKFDRHTIGERLFALFLDCTLAIQRAERQQTAERYQTLATASETLDAIKILIRIAHTMTTLDDRQYEIISATVNEIGRMLGGWMRATKQSVTHTPQRRVR